MPKVRAHQVLKDKAGYHEVGAEFDAAKADAERWIERGSAEAVQSGRGKGSGKGASKSGDSGAQSGQKGNNAEQIAGYREVHEAAIAAGDYNNAREAEVQVRELGNDAIADELAKTREAAEGSAE